NDQSDTLPQTFVLSPGSITLNPAAPITYQGIESITLNTGNAANTFLNPQPFPPEGNFVVNGSAGNDTLVLSAPSGLTFHGGSGQDVLDLEGGSFTVGFDLSVGTSSLTLVVGGNVTLESAQHLAALSVKRGGKVILAPDRKVAISLG